MRSSTAQILETALALQRAPGERFRLHERPLPDDIMQVLEIASGASQALHEVAAELGQDEQGILEAARFYLEQVLFAPPDADAYRVLGAARDAAQDTIRSHHRLLQRWLHPDRALAGDATVFATRVNQAWSQLRTPELRHAYDVRLAEARLVDARAPIPATTIHRWQQEDPEPQGQGRRSRWLLGAALAACAVLAVLIVRNQETAVDWQQPDAAEAAANTSPAMDDSSVGILAEALTNTSPASNPAQVAVPAPIPAPAKPSPALPLRPQMTQAVHAPAMHAPAVQVAPAAAAPKPPVRQTPAGTVIASVTVVAARIDPPAMEAAPPAPIQSQEAIDPSLVLERMRQAEIRLAEVTAFLAAKPGASPLWNDVGTQSAAQQIRTRINARRGARLELIKPAWRLQRDQASLTADYRCRTAGDGVGEGRLDVQLVWREGLWLVRSIELAGPAA